MSSGTSASTVPPDSARTVRPSTLPSRERPSAAATEPSTSTATPRLRGRQREALALARARPTGRSSGSSTVAAELCARLRRARGRRRRRRRPARRRRSGRRASGRTRRPRPHRPAARTTSRPRMKGRRARMEDDDGTRPCDRAGSAASRMARRGVAASASTASPGPAGPGRALLRAGRPPGATPAPAPARPAAPATAARGRAGRRRARSGSSAGTPPPRARSGSPRRPSAMVARAQVLREGEHRLARGGAERVARRLEPPVVQPAAVAQLLEHLGRDPQPERGAAPAAARPVPHGGSTGASRLAQQRGDLRQRQHAVARRVVDARQIVPRRVLEHAVDVVLVDELVARVEAEDRRARPGSANSAVWLVRSVRARARWRSAARTRSTPGLRSANASTARSASTTSFSSAGPRRMRALHVLREEGRVVALAAVEVRGGLEDHLAHRRVRPAARGEDVHRPDDVVLVRDARRARWRSRRSAACRPPCRSPRRGRSAAAARAGCRRGRTPCGRARTSGRPGSRR